MTLHFSVEQRAAVSVPVGDVGILNAELKAFGPDRQMQRARRIAALLEDASDGGFDRAISVSEPEQTDIFNALDRIAQRTPLSEPLLALRQACASE